MISFICGTWKIQQKFLERWGYRQLYLPVEKYDADQKQQLEPDMEQHGTIDWFWTGKGVCQGCILSPCVFNC